MKGEGMSQQGSSFDMSKLSTADKIVLGAAAAYFVWVFLPVWYSCCSLLGSTVSLGSVSGFRGVIIISWILALLAILEVVANRVMSMNINLPMNRGQVHLGVAGLALLFTLLGLVAKSTGLTLGWGIFVGVVIAAVWTYGAYMMYSEPDSGTSAGGMPNMPDGGTMS
jgi:hypothetical protein